MSVKKATVNPVKESSCLSISKTHHQEYNGSGKHLLSTHAVGRQGLAESGMCTLPAEQPQIGT